MTSTTITIDYTNWRGERSLRQVQPIRIEHGSNEWHRTPQWLLVAIDLRTGEERTFALSCIHAIYSAAGGRPGTGKHRSPTAEEIELWRAAYMDRDMSSRYAMMHAAFPRLLDEVARLQDRLERLEKVTPHLDNHHNAVLCPYCNPDGIDLEAAAQWKSALEKIKAGKEKRLPDGTTIVVDIDEDPADVAATALAWTRKKETA